MGHFLSDRDKSEEAVELIAKHLISNGCEVRELPREEQKKGDLEVTRGSESSFVEIKYDMMAKRTGNLCFEMSNGKRPTGIMETEAKFVYYVVPQKGVKMVFMFDTQKLRDYITQPGNATIKNGGDKKKFVLALVPIADVLARSVECEFFTIRD